MMIDHVDNILKYEALLPNLRKGLEAFETVKNAAGLAPGRYEFEGGYFLVQQGETRPISEGTFEAHRNYIDVQIMAEGSEEMAWEDIRKLETVIPYQEEKDAERLTGKREHVVKITKGMFYAAFPWDGHQAVAHTEERQRFLKVVMKLRVG